MNDFLSLRYLNSLIGAASGIATLDANGKLDTNMIPASVTGNYLGSYATLEELQTAHAAGTTGQYALVAGVKYYWNAAMTTPAWTSVEISVTAYNALTTNEKNGQPEWLIIP